METLKLWIEPVAVIAVAMVLGYLFRRVFVQRMTLLSRRTKTELDDLLVEACKGHIPFWFLLGGLTLATRRAPLGPEWVGNIDLLLSDAFILSLTLVASSLVTGLILRTTARAEGTFASSSLLRNVVRGSIVTLGLLVIVHRHTNIAPILGALGIGSLAVALALQPTLSNLFAGLHITLAKPMRIGDFVELENGVQGFIVDIGWRATQLREPNNNLVIVPNARLVEMIAKNFALPEPQQTVAVRLGVSYGSDLARVEAVTREVAREVLRSSSQAVADFEPVLRFLAFSESSIDFSVALRVKHFTERGEVVHDFIKRLKERYEREGIEIPFPQRVLHGARAALSGPGQRP